MASFFKSRVLNFNIDHYINPYIRRLPVERLPYPISRFLGHRRGQQSSPSNLVIWFWAFIGAFVALIIIESLNRYPLGLTKWHPPVVIASFGAAAILEYNAITAPLSQPRNLVLGQTFSAIVGVCITKLFRLNPNFVNIEWLAGALACAIASAVMGLTGTVYPPAGATAVLAATNTIIIDQGWMYIPFVLLDSILFLIVALLINNIQRQFPMWWWTPQELKVLGGPTEKQREQDQEKQEDDEKSGDDKDSSGSHKHEIVVRLDGMSIPAHLDLTTSEESTLKSLQDRLIAASKSNAMAET